jgi:hypothetical protein
MGVEMRRKSAGAATDVDVGGAEDLQVGITSRGLRIPMRQGSNITRKVPAVRRGAQARSPPVIRAGYFSQEFTAASSVTGASRASRKIAET